MDFPCLSTLARPNLALSGALVSLPLSLGYNATHCWERSSSLSAGSFKGFKGEFSTRIGEDRISGRNSWSNLTRNSAMAKTTQVKEGVELRVYENVDNLSPDLAEYVAEISKAAVEERGVFSVVLSGGSLISTMGKLTEAPYLEKIDWSRWHVFWADERVVPLDHPDSNYKLALDGLLSKVPIPSGNIYAINDQLSPQKAAEDYESGIRQLVKKNVVPLNEAGDYPRFDLMLLGMGPDGHLASLFPNHPLVSKTDTWVASIEDSPKPPPERITLTLPVINASANIGFVVTGSGKADKLKLVFGGDIPFGQVPSKLVSPEKGKLVWFADEAAVSKL